MGDIHGGFHHLNRNLNIKLVSVVLILLAPALTSCTKVGLPVDCSDIFYNDKSQPSGVYAIYPTETASAVQVHCDMDTEGGRWTKFQRRFNGQLNFYGPWESYKTGFGCAAEEHWLGLENLLNLTLRKKHELLVDMEDSEGNKVFARYSLFSLDPESEGYTLHVSVLTDGGAGDALFIHNGHIFSTFNKDQDAWNQNCAKSFMGAFWYSDCLDASPNGVYLSGTDGFCQAVGVEWKTWKGYDHSLKTISMKIRPME